MTQEDYKEAFVAGFVKRAEQHGFEKQAIVGMLAGTGLRLLAPIFGQHYLTKGLGAIAARKGAGRVGKHAKNLHTLLTESPMVSRSLGDNLKGQAAFMGTSILADRALNPIVDPLATKLEQRDYRRN
jgi:hypothetical protein